jgi:MoaA/NifB/PqqE/SkfB family radical SAM enzyme
MKYIDPPAKLLQHVDRIAAIGRGENPPPVNVEIDLTNRCNLGCAFCHFAYVHSRGPLARTATHNTGDVMQTGLALSILEQLGAAGVRSVTWTGGGEPTLHPDFAEIAGACSLPQGVYTNGTRIDPYRAAVMKARMKWVYVSLDRHDRDSYRAYKRVDGFARAVQGIRALVRASGPAVIGVGFLLDRTNVAYGNEMVDLALGLGADYVQFRPAVEFDLSAPGRAVHDNTWIKPAVQWLAGAVDRNHGQVIADLSRFEMYRNWRGHGYPLCYWAQLQAVITPDGRAWTCVNRRGFAGDCLGDLNEEPFMSIWARSRAYPVDEKCRVLCRGHVPNLALDRILGDSRPPHWEFV